MPAPEALLGFLAAVIVLVLVPGPNTALILAHSLAGGRRAGIATVAGVELGTAVHTVAAALGLSAVVASSTFAFELVKLTGAAALLVMGARDLLRRHDGSTVAQRAMAPGRALLRALVGNVLNPKVAIFFLAFLPQWLDPAHPLLPQLLVLGAIVTAVGAACGTALALTAGGYAARLARHPAFWRSQHRCTGALLIAVGLRLACGANG